MRYIDADLIEYHDSFTNDGEFMRVAFGDDIDAIPTADVKPVVRGEWKDVNENQNVKRFDHYECSVCHMRYAGDYNYCPNCGSKMKEVEDER